MEKHEFKKQKLDKEQEKKQELELLPTYFRPIDLDDKEKQRIVNEIWEEWEAIQRERDEDNLETTWESLKNQYDGKMERSEDAQFNLSRPTTKIKIRGIARHIHSAFFESEPRYTISPRPEFQREGGQEVTEKQTDFLDYKLDTEVPFDTVKRKVIHSSCLYGVGIEKMYHEIIRRKRKRSETYKGNPIVEVDQKGMEIVINKPLDDFLDKYPDAPQWAIKALSEGKEINYEVEYTETQKNDPLPKFVDIRNFYVRTSTDLYQGLCDALLIGEKVEYSWWELKNLEKKGIFNNIEDLKYNVNEKGEIDYTDERDGYKSTDYTIRECTYQAKLRDNDEEVKCVFWIEEDSKVMIGASYYMWEGVDCVYNPHYVIIEREGFYQPGIAEAITDLHLAENLFLNFGLEGAYISNMVTPIAPKGSDIEKQFLNKDWAHGVTLNADPGKGGVDFLQKYMKPTNLRDVIIILQTLAKATDDVTGHSQLMTGRESEIDPDAPASKTIALMQRSGLNIRDYIKCMLPAYNRTAEILLQMYYEISKEGRKFKIRADRVTDRNDIFETISREEMIAKTNIEATATSFNLDKLNERRSDLALYQVVRQELMIAKNPQAVHSLLKNLIKSWSPKWRNIVEHILPNLEDLKKREMAVALQAAAGYLNSVIQQTSGRDLNPEQAINALNIQKMKNIIDIARKDLVTQPSKEEIKMREKIAKGE